MSGTTCRNGFIFVAAICLGLMVTSARGGTLEAPAAPTNSASAMYTLENIHNYLTTGMRTSKRTGSFTEPTYGPTNGTMHTLNEIMEAGIIPQKTGQTTSYATDDDGGLQIGLAWPNPRFTVLGDTNVVDVLTNCVLDNLTGLIWARNALNAGGWASATTNWGDAVTNCNNLDYGGQTDWRLPNEQEFSSLIDASQSNPALPTGHPFTGVQSATYWSSSTYKGNPATAWYVKLSFGTVSVEGGVNKTTAMYYVWPVRGGQ